MKPIILLIKEIKSINNIINISICNNIKIKKINSPNEIFSHFDEFILINESQTTENLIQSILSQFTTLDVQLYNIDTVLLFLVIESSFKFNFDIHFIDTCYSKKYIYLPIDSKIKFKVELDSIEYIHAEGNYSIITSNNRKFIQRMPLNKLSGILGDQFIQIHKTYIVNTQKIVKLNLSKNEITLSNNIIIPIGRSFRKIILKKLNI